MKTGSVMDFLIVWITVMKPTAMVRNSYDLHRLISMNYAIKYREAGPGSDYRNSSY